MAYDKDAALLCVAAQWEKWPDDLLMLMGGRQGPTMTIPSSTLSHTM